MQDQVEPKWKSVWRDNAAIIVMASMLGVVLLIAVWLVLDLMRTGG